MKTITTITTLIAIVIMFSANLNASPVNFNEESLMTFHLSHQKFATK